MISEFPLLIFTVFAGIAAGAYGLSAIFPPEEKENARRWVFPVVCIVLLGIGLLGTLMHLQHPERFMNAMANPGAMITEEAYWSTAFGIVLLIDALLSIFRKGAPRWLRIVGALAAFGLMVVTSIAYASNYGVPAWRGIATFPLFLVGDIAMGAALLGAFENQLLVKRAFVYTNIGVEALLAIVLIALAVQFAGVGVGTVLVYISIVVAPVAGVFLMLVASKKPEGNAAIAWLAVACVVIGVFLSRYAFYAACPF